MSSLFYKAPQINVVEDFLYVPPVELIQQGIQTRDAQIQQGLKDVQLPDDFNMVFDEFQTEEARNYYNNIEQNINKYSNEILKSVGNPSKISEIVRKAKSDMAKDVQVGTIKNFLTNKEKIAQARKAAENTDDPVLKQKYMDAIKEIAQNTSKDELIPELDILVKDRPVRKEFLEFLEKKNPKEYKNMRFGFETDTYGNKREVIKTSGGKVLNLSGKEMDSLWNSFIESDPTLKQNIEQREKYVPNYKENLIPALKQAGIEATTVNNTSNTFEIDDTGVNNKALEAIANSSPSADNASVIIETNAPTIDSYNKSVKTFREYRQAVIGNLKLNNLTYKLIYKIEDYIDRNPNASSEDILKSLPAKTDSASKAQASIYAKEYTEHIKHFKPTGVVLSSLEFLKDYNDLDSKAIEKIKTTPEHFTSPINNSSVKFSSPTITGLTKDEKGVAKGITNVPYVKEKNGKKVVNPDAFYLIKPGTSMSDLKNPEKPKTVYRSSEDNVTISEEHFNSLPNSSKQNYKEYVMILPRVPAKAPFMFMQTDKLKYDNNYWQTTLEANLVLKNDYNNIKGNLVDFGTEEEFEKHLEKFKGVQMTKIAIPIHLSSSDINLSAK